MSEKDKTVIGAVTMIPDAATGAPVYEVGVTGEPWPMQGRDLLVRASILTEALEITQAFIELLAAVEIADSSTLSSMTAFNDRHLLAVRDGAAKALQDSSPAFGGETACFVRLAGQTMEAEGPWTTAPTAGHLRALLPQAGWTADDSAAALARMVDACAASETKGLAAATRAIRAATGQRVTPATVERLRQDIFGLVPRGLKVAPEEPETIDVSERQGDRTPLDVPFVRLTFRDGSEAVLPLMTDGAGNLDLVHMVGAEAVAPQAVAWARSIAAEVAAGGVGSGLSHEVASAQVVLFEHGEAA